MTTQVEVKERPILFSSEMVKAILEGRKTQTRRVLKPQPASEDSFWPSDESHIEFWQLLDGWAVSWCPYGKPGERLWVKENAYIAPPNFGRSEDANLIDNLGRSRVVSYSVDMSEDAVRCAEDFGVKQRSSLLMPRWASRITLEITGVRVERVQSISREDIEAEGTPAYEYPGQFSYRNDYYQRIRDFRHLWDNINGTKPGRDWNSNPWVWVIEFKRV